MTEKVQVVGTGGIGFPSLEETQFECSEMGALNLSWDAGKLPWSRWGFGHVFRVEVFTAEEERMERSETGRYLGLLCRPASLIRKFHSL